MSRYSDVDLAQIHEEGRRAGYRQGCCDTEKAYEDELRKERDRVGRAARGMSELLRERDDLRERLEIARRR